MGVGWDGVGWGRVEWGRGVEMHGLWWWSVGGVDWGGVTGVDLGGVEMEWTWVGVGWAAMCNTSYFYAIISYCHSFICGQV